MTDGWQWTEIGEIPEDWQVKPLHSFATVSSGKRLPAGYLVEDLATPYPYIRVADMRVGSVDTKNMKFVPVKAYPPISRYRIFKDDIFISVAGTLGIVGKIPETLDGANLTENANRISEIKCNRDYLMYTLMSQGIQNIIESIQTVGAQPKLALTRIRSFPIALPPPAEQTAIANVLSDTDKLLDSLQRLIDKKQGVKQAVMQQLLSGQTRLPGFDGEWQVRRLGDVAEIQMGQSPESVFYNREENGVPLIQGNADIKDRRSISRIWTTEITKSGKADDLLLTVRAPVGEVAIISKNCCLGRGVCSLSPLINADFLFQCLIFSESVWNTMEQGSTFTSVNSKQIADFTVSIPDDLSEQTAIAQMLSDMDAEITALHKRLGKTRQLKQALMQELLSGKTRLRGQP